MLLEDLETYNITGYFPRKWYLKASEKAEVAETTPMSDEMLKCWFLTGSNWNTLPGNWL